MSACHDVEAELGFILFCVYVNFAYFLVDIVCCIFSEISPCITEVLNVTDVVCRHWKIVMYSRK